MRRVRISDLSAVVRSFCIVGNMTHDLLFSSVTKESARRPTAYAASRVDVWPRWRTTLTLSARSLGLPHRVEASRLDLAIKEAPDRVVEDVHPLGLRRPGAEGDSEAVRAAIPKALEPGQALG